MSVDTVMTETRLDDDETAVSSEESALPVSYANFATLRENGAYYADKTGLLHSLIRNGRPYFLSRPRRFGKSLIVDTLDTILRGRRELFKGLAIDGLNYDWAPHPVLKLEMNKVVAEPEELYGRLSSYLRRLALADGIELEKEHPADMLDLLLDILYRKHKEKAKVAVLIDEYDAPIVRHIDRPEAAQKARSLLADFYGMLKTSEKKLGHVFITGVSRFAKTSMFSSLNNLWDLTFDRRYAGICGFTEADLDALLDVRHAETLKELIENGNMPEGSGRDDLKREIEDWYDGYSWDGKTKVYNPWSVLSFFEEAEFSNHWYESGSPGFLIDMMRDRKLPFNYMDGELIINRTEAIIDKIPLLKPSVLMLQAGYMTIKERIPPADGRLESFRLDLPNREVVMSFVPELLSAGPPNKTPAREASAKSVLDGLRRLDEEAIQRAFGDYLDQFRFNSILEHEAYYQSLLEVALEWAGQEIESRHATSQGILDILFSGHNDRYIVELKVFREKTAQPDTKPLPPTDPVDESALREMMAPKADEALKQIRERYAKKFRSASLVHGIAVVVARRTFVLAKIEKDDRPPFAPPVATGG